ncbi:HalOD1 output domain-containing protein [Natronosalvus caseinilyticus]|uniref:HalOD1 output domain-containing protein n=1 Tax=Natronosalvus caseinilyticus TaxID=2953747 RepID=UPI0028B13D18|nr:HalOD1 output domain-containing protein [Natronosalvus caseinilyticus]
MGNHYWPVDGESPTLAVVQAVAAAAGRQPEDLEPLYDFVDGDALNEVLEGGDDVRVRFEFAGFDVDVTPEEVCLTERV